MQIMCCHFLCYGDDFKSSPEGESARHHDKPEQAGSDPASCGYPTLAQVSLSQRVATRAGGRG